MIPKVLIGAVFVVSLSWGTEAQVNCTSTGAGRFANPSDTTCKNYTLCVYVASNASYISYDYICPTTSVFSTVTNQCTAPSNFVCNVTDATDNSTSVCTSEEYIADPSVDDCSAYIMCTLIDGEYVETNFTCPTNTYYNPNTTLCDSTYSCPPTSFTCSAAGRFADTTDTTCQNYFLCALLTSGSYIQYNYTCPSTSMFNPTTKLCSATYICTN